MAEHHDIREGLDTEPVVRVSGEFSLLPHDFGEDLKASKTRLLLDHRFQLVHYLDADGVETNDSRVSGRGRPCPGESRRRSCSPARRSLDRPFD